MRTEYKKRKLSYLYQRLVKFTDSPLYKFRKQNNYKPVLGIGNLDAKIIFVGEAPGKNEAIQGKSFIGASGRLLDEFLKEAKLNRDNIFISAVVHDRPPKNRDPKPNEIIAYSPFLSGVIEIIQPQIIVTLGRFAMVEIFNKFGLSEKVEPISKIHGQLFRGIGVYGKIQIMPFYHPASALYKGTLKVLIKKDYKKLLKLAY